MVVGEEVRVRFVATPEIHLEGEDIPLTILYEVREEEP